MKRNKRLTYDHYEANDQKVDVSDPPELLLHGLSWEGMAVVVSDRPGSERVPPFLALTFSLSLSLSLSLGNSMTSAKICSNIRGEERRVHRSARSRRDQAGAKRLTLMPNHLQKRLNPPLHLGTKSYLFVKRKLRFTDKWELSSRIFISRVDIAAAINHAFDGKHNQ